MTYTLRLSNQIKRNINKIWKDNENEPEWHSRWLDKHSVDGQMKCERFMNIHHQSADSTFSNEHGNSTKWATVHNYNRQMRYVAKPDYTTYIYWPTRGTRKWNTSYSSTYWNLTSEQYHLSHILWFNITTVIVHKRACQVSNTRTSNGASTSEHKKGNETSSIIQTKSFDA